MEIWTLTCIFTVSKLDPSQIGRHVSSIHSLMHACSQYLLAAYCVPALC